MSFAPQPSRDHDPSARTAVLLCNLGTPDAPTTPAVRRYLAQFLSDPRVVEIPRALWKPILHGVILRVRPSRSAAKYASIWTPEGSPLRVWTEKQTTLLTGYLGERGHSVLVRAAMRYGTPSIAHGLDELTRLGATRVLVLPLYPQYAAATTASVFDAVCKWASRTRRLPELRFVNGYADDSGYIDALEHSVRDHWKRDGAAGKLVLSFHGLPERSARLGDPYATQCKDTANLLAQRLGLAPEHVLVTFQSRFGKAKWLQPYTQPSLRRLAADGVKSVDVMCPGFAADCLETLEEIAMEARAAFLRAGGEQFRYIGALNDRHTWIAALAALTIRHLQGWPTAHTTRQTT
jgi:protoporphyrin/coproporphyrin ferrochelatase